MSQLSSLSCVALLSLVALTSGLHAQTASAIEQDLTIITAVGKTLTDPVVAEFANYAKRKWNINIRTGIVAAGAPLVYGRVIEWNGRPAADIAWGGETLLFDRLTERNLLAPLNLPRATVESIPLTIGAPKPVRLRDPKGYWIGTVLESYGIVYHPRLYQLSAPKVWDDLLDPRLKGQVVQCAPTLSGSSHGAYEVLLQRDGEEPGWRWLKRLGANTGMFAARSRDVPSLVAKGEFAAGFAAPSYMALEDRLAGFDIRYVAPKTATLSIGTIAVLNGSAHPNAARAFVEFMLSDEGQRVAIDRGVFPINPKLRVEGPPGSVAETAVAFVGGVRSYFDQEFVNVYDEILADKRYQQVNAIFRAEIESVWHELKTKN